MNRRSLLRAILAAPGLALVPVEPTPFCFGPVRLTAARTLTLGYHDTPALMSFTVEPSGKPLVLLFDKKLPDVPAGQSHLVHLERERDGNWRVVTAV